MSLQFAGIVRHFIQHDLRVALAGLVRLEDLVDFEAQHWQQQLQSGAWETGIRSSSLTQHGRLLRLQWQAKMMHLCLQHWHQWQSSIYLTSSHNKLQTQHGRLRRRATWMHSYLHRWQEWLISA